MEMEKRKRLDEGKRASETLSDDLVLTYYRIISKVERAGTRTFERNTDGD